MLHLTDREVKFYNLFYLFAVCGLNIIQIRTMLLRYNNGYTISQISKLDGVSKQAIHKRIWWALRKIKKSSKLYKFAIG